MDQAELNAGAQKWLEALLHPDENEEAPAADTDAVAKGSHDLGVVLDRLRHLMKVENVPKTSLRAGGTHLAVLARSLGAYLHVSLESKDLERAAKAISEQTTKWLLTVFKLSGKDMAAHYHDDSRDGLARVFQMALCQKYDKYILDGLSSLYLKPPVVYISDAGQAVDCFHVCSRLGLPMSSISFVPCNTLFGSHHSMDIAALDKRINDDLTEGKVPVMVIAYAGTPLAGHIENLPRLKEICTQHGMWLHVLGHALSSLCTSMDDPEIVGAREADSLMLCPGTWFGLLSCPTVTLHRSPMAIETESVPNSSNFPPESVEVPEKAIPIPQLTWTGMQPHGMNRLLPLTLWLGLQYLGSNTLVETVSYCSNLTQHMISKLDEVPGVRRFEVPNHRSFVVLFKYFGGGKVDFVQHLPSTPEKQMVEEGSRAESTEQQNSGHVTPVARAEETSEPQPEEAQTQGGDSPLVQREMTSSSEPTNQPPSKIVVEELPLPTANAANTLIIKELYPVFPKVGIRTLKLPRDGVCFKFDPINSFPEHSTSIEDVDRFIDALKLKVFSLHPTSLARCLIESTLRGQPNLRCLEFPSFFASGFIQYVPTDWANKTELTLEEVNQLNKLNLELAASLTQRNPIYTPFQHGNFTCIMIRELPEDASIHDFVIELVEETKKFEESKKVLEGMSEKIRMGIEAAETDLSKEKEKKQQEEGLLRYVPIVGSVLSWFSPPTPTTPEGRTFSLSSGKVQTTTSTYKYKMQVEEATASQEPVQDLQDKQDGEEGEKKEGEGEEKEEGEGEEDTSDPPAEQSVSQDTTGEPKQEEEGEEATES